MVDLDRLAAAFETARCDLLAESSPIGHWTGANPSSSYATAAAICALATVERHAPTVEGRLADEQRECQLSQLIMKSVRSLARRQNADGGWSDEPGGQSQLPVTMLVRAAFGLTCVPADIPGLLEKCDAYIRSHGCHRALRAGDDKNLKRAAPIMAACALAGLTSWRRVPSLPFERLCLPETLWKSLPLGVSSDALPVLIAVGQARWHHRKTFNPLRRYFCSAALHKTSRLLNAWQSADGSFAGDVATTSFVVMSLASVEPGDQDLVRRGVEFLLRTVKSDGSWPAFGDQSVLSTARALGATAAAGEEMPETAALSWLIDRQQQHALLTGTPAGGWAASDSSAALAETTVTAEAVAALAAWSKAGLLVDARLRDSAARGLTWLLETQNTDGGWPARLRGWHTQTSDHSAAPSTAAALRALGAWHAILADGAFSWIGSLAALEVNMIAAIDRGLVFLTSYQSPAGYWAAPNEKATAETPRRVTASVLLACHQAKPGGALAPRALDWLAADTKSRASHADAVVAEALLVCGRACDHEIAASAALARVIDGVEANRHLTSDLPATVTALARAKRQLSPSVAAPVAVHTEKV